jgi:hypothetical protein
VDAKYWDSKSEGLDPKYENRKMQRLRETCERGQAKGVKALERRSQEHGDSVINARYAPGVISRGSTYRGS